MQRHILLHLTQGAITLLILSVIVFVLVRATGDPARAMLPIDATAQDVADLRQALGLDKPYPLQYAIFLERALRLDFGKSLMSRKPVTELLLERLGNSAGLAAAAFLITLAIGIPLGVLGALRKNSSLSSLITAIGVLGQATPSFWLAVILIEVFAVAFGLLPAAGADTIWHYILPAFTMGLFLVAGVMRLVRSSLLDVLESDFIHMARIKGVPESRIIWKHALRNALLPVLTFGGVYFSILITASVAVETVFAWPGVGRLAYEGLMNRDFPVVQGVVIVGAVLVVLVNLTIDILYAYVDPRIRYG